MKDENLRLFSKIKWVRGVLILLSVYFIYSLGKGFGEFIY